MTLPDHDANVIRELCEKVTAASTYGCMPTMEMHDASRFCDHAELVGDYCESCPNEVAEASA